MSAVGAVVMAAGAGRRMGCRPKSLLQRDGESLLLRQVRLLRQCGVGDISVVLGHHAERLQVVLVAAQAAGLVGDASLAWVRNPAPDDGPGSSLRYGLRSLPDELDTVLVVLGDQPLLEAEDVRVVLDAWQARAPGIELVVPSQGGEPGHPIAFGRRLREAVLRGQGGAGVREWRRAHRDQVQELVMTHARHVADIDTPEDLQALARAHGVRLAWPDEEPADGVKPSPAASSRGLPGDQDQPPR